MRAVLVLTVLAGILLGDNWDSIPMTEWAGPPGSRPGTYEEWVGMHPIDTGCHYVELDTSVTGGGRIGGG